MESKKGLVMVYTGDGKGKTTASLGMALRAAGHDQKVFIIQFMKGSDKYGEVKVLRKFLPNIELVQKGLDTFVKKGNPSKRDIELAKEGLELAKSIISSGKYHIVILDEINVAVDYGLIKKEEVLDLIEKKPKDTTIILTGRYACREIMEKADMISEVKEIKHHYKQGIIAQPGIEY